MKSLTVRRVLLLAAPLIGIGLIGIGSENASAQNRNRDSFGSLQQNGFGTGNQSRFGSSQQFGVGQRQQGGRNSGRTSNQNRRQDDFVGSDAQQIRRQRNSRTQGRRQRVRIDYTVENLNSQRASSQQSTSSSFKKPPIQVQLRPLFTVQLSSASELSTQASARLNQALPTRVAGTQISVSDGTATIEGSVKSEYDRQLAARILSLQPGISQIENRLTIESAQVAPLLLPAQ